MTLAAAFAVLVTLLILLNVVTRAFNVAIYWVDEAAIYAMVWMTFLAASAALHSGHSVAVTILRDLLPLRYRGWMAKFVDVTVFLFAAAMAWLCWRWFLPIDLARAGFDFAAFQAETFNFVYAEPTTTLGIRKFWVWLVMPLFAFGTVLHGLNNLLDFSGSTERGA